MTVKLLPSFTLETHQLEVHSLSTTDMTFRQHMIEILREINTFKYSFDVRTNLLWTYTNPLDLHFTINPNVPEATTFFHIALTLAKYYDGSPILAWKDGFVSFDAKLRSTTNNSGFDTQVVEQLVKYLVKKHFFVSKFYYDIDEYNLKLGTAQTKITSFIEDNHNWPNNWLKEDLLKDAAKHLTNIKKALSILAQKQQICDKAKYLEGFTQSPNLFVYSHQDISDLSSDIEHLNNKIHKLTYPALQFADKIKLVAYLR